MRSILSSCVLVFAVGCDGVPSNAPDASTPADAAPGVDAAGTDAGPDPCAGVSCDHHATCTLGHCTCGPGFSGDGQSCTAIADPCISAGTCPEGVWVRHILDGVGGPDTIETVLVDPVRPSDFYAFVGSNTGPTIKVMFSSDYGETWVNHNTTAELLGNPWGASIDPNPHRDPSTPPTMWTPSGYGSSGAWKSTDGGVTWERSAGADVAFGPFNPYGPLATDLYHVQILPDDPPNHVLATYHYGFADNDSGGFGETWDGGETWVIHPPATGMGTSHYVIPISGTTWAVIAQDNSGMNGIWRTTTAGRVGGTVENHFRDGTISTDAWHMVDDLEHAHGAHENIVLPDGTILASGLRSGAISRDQGATWTHFTDGAWAPPHMFEQSLMTNIAVTARFAYINVLGDPTMARAPIDSLVGAENWDIAYCDRPADYTIGGAPFGMASSYNPSADRWVVIAGSYDGTLWKYVEPPP